MIKLHRLFNKYYYWLGVSCWLDEERISGLRMHAAGNGKIKYEFSTGTRQRPAKTHAHSGISTKKKFG